MKNYRFCASVEGENIIQSASWNGIIRAASKLAKANAGRIVTVKDATGQSGESFIWSADRGTIVPA